MTTTPTTIDTFFKQFPTQTFDQNEIALSATTKPDYFYYVESGAVKMSLVSHSGRNLNLHIFFPNTFFPLLTLVNETFNPYDFIALTTTLIRKAPYSECVSFINNNSQILIELQKRLLKGLDGLLHRIEQTAFAPAYSRVAGILVYFSRHFSEPLSNQAGSRTMSLKITHQEIADWLGLSRENVSIQMKLLEQHGLIKTTNHLLAVPDLEKLQKAAEPSNLV